MLRSLAIKLVVLAVVFVAAPMILYGTFRDAYSEKNEMLHRSVREQGRLLAEGVRPFLEDFDGRSIIALNTALNRLADGRLKVRLLFQPKKQEGKSEGFYLIAAAPEAPADQLERERQELIDLGVLDKLPASCEGDLPIALRSVTLAGQEEVLTSMTPMNAASGCWVAVTSHLASDIVGSALATPYWNRPEVRVALVIYIFMAALVFWFFATIWGSARRFERVARDIQKGATEASFDELNAAPELSGVAQQLDELVLSLRSSAQALRSQAEENAHAVKSPLAVISQSVEPLKRALPQSDASARRAVELIEQSVLRLAALISAARRMDEAAEEVRNPPHERIELAAFLARMVQGYSQRAGANGHAIHLHASEPAAVLAGGELLETVIENLLENAISFSEPGRRITVRLDRHEAEAELSVEDEGPGVDPKNLPRIFERYYSHRPADGAETLNGSAQSHFGIGLWIVKRNVEAIGGRVWAENGPEGGLRVMLRLPLAT